LVLPVKALARLFRRLFLATLEAASDNGERCFFGELVPLVERLAFVTGIGSLRKTNWVVCAKPPLGGPEPGAPLYGFHRIRNYGRLARGDRAERLALCHRLPAAANHPVKPKVHSCEILGPS
jgi:hypothetical protein